MYDHDYGQYGGWHGGPAGHDPAIFLLSMLPWILFAVAGGWVLLNAWAHQRTPALPADEPSAVEMLSQRYVRGEIDVATFEEMLGRILGAEQHERMTVGTSKANMAALPRQAVATPPRFEPGTTRMADTPLPSAAPFAPPPPSLSREETDPPPSGTVWV